MRHGVPILGTVTKQCRVDQLKKNLFRIVLTQGLNRQIRRMCEYLGYKVLTLKRVRIMHLQLDGLRVGEWRALTEEELRELKKAIQ
jgi:23S rRNA pseudouridine2604 synthase